LWELVEKRHSKSVLIGPIHGDLHATNVLVRGADAIVIDFEKVLPTEPLLYDAASLEGSLLVDGFFNDKRSTSEWLASISKLYEKGAVLGLTEPCHPKDGSAWFYDCVRQIRIHARELECEPFQYATVLAVVLAKKSCNTHEFPNEKRETLRAAAYLFAERILLAETGAQQ